MIDRQNWFDFNKQGRTIKKVSNFRKVFATKAESWLFFLLIFASFFLYFGQQIRQDHTRSLKYWKSLAG